MTILQTTCDRTELSGIGVARLFCEKGLAAIKAYLRLVFDSRLSLTGTGAMRHWVTIESWRKHLTTNRAFSFYDRLVAGSLSAKTCALNATIFALSIIVRRIKHFVAVQTLPLLYEYMLTFSPSVMVAHMFRRCKKFQIFKSVVCFYAVFMVNVFVRAKFSAKKFCHYKSVFQRLNFKITQWFKSCVDANVASSINCFSASPLVMICAVVHWNVSFIKLPLQQIALGVNI